MDRLLKILIGVMIIINIAFAGSLYLYVNSSENVIWTQIKNLI
jgi:YbbR domain-containing protein